MLRLFVVICVCSVNSYRIFPLPVQPFPPEIEIAAESVNADVVYTNIPTTTATDYEVATSPIATSKSTNSINVSEADTSLVSAVSETKNLAELAPTSTTANSYTASGVSNQSEIVDILSVLDSANAITTPASNTKQLLESEPESTTTKTTDSVSSEASLSESSRATSLSIESLPTSTSSSDLAATSLTGSKPSGTVASKIEETSTSLSDSEEISGSSESPSITSSISPSTVPDTSDTTRASSSSNSETESYLLIETTTEDLSFLSLDLLPPKVEYRKNEPDPRYDY